MKLTETKVTPKARKMKHSKKFWGRFSKEYVCVCPKDLEALVMKQVMREVKNEPT